MTRLIKTTELIIFLFISLCSFSQEDTGWKTILNEEFNNNYNGWHTESSELRYAQISNGQLIDRFSNEGYVQANRIPIDLNYSKDYKISFSFANLNGDASKKYRVYHKRNNGKLKEGWENNPVWGFVWGFKDWNNYNTILFYNSREYNTYASGNYIYSTSVKILYKSGGETTTLKDWTKYQYVGSNDFSITIEKYGGNSVRIYTGDNILYAYTGGVFQWYGDKIGPYIGAGAKVALDYVFVTEKGEHPNTSWNEYSLKSHWDGNGANLIEGIYENSARSENSPKYKLGLIKEDNDYRLVYLGGAENPGWKIGDIKAYLTKTATPNLYKVKYFMGDKTINEDLYISFENGLMKIIWPDRQENLYIKLYPTSSDNINSIGSEKSSGTGFALSSNGYIVTNHHVTNGASSIKVRGVKGNFSKTYKAKVIIEDKNNDLSIIKIDDPSFTNLGILPYTINSDIADAGKSVYALGYPLRATMGDEVKLTDGIISSKSGFQGDITSYQITVPIQPGNSGGPLFDSNGSIVGIINAKHIGAENASYAIKTSYLMNLIQVMNTTPNLPKTNTISGKSLSEQVKYLKEFIYIIEIN
ncbi:S1C family serine protease [Salegentibacter chungangensis]|uniref:S1C family serine protease n=1 Tax=Salegentibacter chungangensis TaxID=1335724 RepID=A0ABW3NRC5_9FLAO